MKFANRIFLVLGAMSVFSLVQFDAMGVAYDGRADCTSNATPGYYCQKAGKKPACPVGCYCPGGVKTAVGDNSQNFGQVKSACENHWSGEVKAYLEARGIYYCPDDFPTTATSTSYTRGQCKTKGSPVIYLESGAADCTNTPEAGEYCKTAGTHNSCPSGCYCPGGSKEAAGTDINVGKACTKGNTFYPSRLNLANVYKCPDRFPFSDSGAKGINECYDIYNTTDKLHYKQLNCGVGKYLPKLAEECSTCPEGYRCPGTGFRKHWLPSKDEDKGLYKCADGETANDDHTACVSSSSGGGGGNPGCNYTVTYRNNYPISNIASVTANDLRAELSAMDVEDYTEYVPADFNSVNRPVATQNSQTGLCQGASVTLRNAPTAPNGYTFNYWDCRSIGHKMPGETFNMPAGNVICTAQWTGNTACSYKVEFNKGNTAVSGSVAAIAGICQNESVYVTPNPGFSWDDHTFDGWSCVNSVNNTSLSINDNHITMPSANVTCTAQWTQSGNGGGVSCDPGQYWDEDEEDYCADCSAGYFCPGDGDEYRCPIPLSQTSSGASCRGNVSKTQMYGNNCWKYTGNASNYRNCVYGIRLENYRH